MSTKRGGFYAPSVLLSEQQICDFVHSFLALNISSDHIEDRQDIIASVTNAEHTKCSRAGHDYEKKVLVWFVKFGGFNDITRSRSYCESQQRFALALNT